MSETLSWLTSTVDENLEIVGYTLIRADNPLILSQVIFAFTTNTLLISGY